MTSVNFMALVPSITVYASFNEFEDRRAFTVYGVDAALDFAAVLLNNGAYSVSIEPERTDLEPTDEELAEIDKGFGEDGPYEVSPCGPDCACQDSVEDVSDKRPDVFITLPGQDPSPTQCCGNCPCLSYGGSL